MKTYSVIIPAHNEANFLEGMLQSLCEQTVSALEIILVNDNATDDTETIMQRFSASHANISYVNHDSEAAHLPGAKVIHAFAFGLKHLEQPYDVLVKLDADLLLPENYFETILVEGIEYYILLYFLKKKLFFSFFNVRIFKLTIF